MKIGIFIGIAALGLALFAVPDAHGWWNHGPDINYRVSGSSFTVDVDEETGDSTTLQNSIAKGQPGYAHLDSQVVFGTVGPYEGCPVFGADATANWVAIYRDGSVLTGSGSGSVCTDGVAFTGQVAGEITGTAGRFEGASGTWEADASVENSTFLATLTGDFD